MHNSSLICSDRKHGSEMRTPSTAPRSSFPVRGEGAELARRKGSMGSAGECDLEDLIDFSLFLYYNVLQKEGIPMTISVRLNDNDAMLFRKYAEMNGMSMSELVRRAVLERIEDDFDMKCYEKAMKEYRENPETFTLDEVEKELGLA